MSNTVIKVENIVKEYNLGIIGRDTLRAEIESRFAKLRGLEDPNSKIGSKNYAKGEKFLALNDISFTVNKCDTLGIIGGNGAGKSTLLKLLSRITAPTKGSIYIRGRIASMLEVGTGFHPELTGRENVYLNGAILGMSKAEVSRKFDEIVAFAEMEQFIDTPVKRYSSGMLVKLAFAVAAHLDAEIMLMDEVLAVGDMKFQQKCLEKMSSVAEAENRTILYVSHNMNTIRQLCNRAIVLDHGTIKYDGNVEEAINLYLNEKIESFSTYSDFTNINRTLPHDACAKLLDFKFLNTQNCEYEYDKPLDFTVRWNNISSSNNLCMCVIVKTLDEMPVATSMCLNLGECSANSIDVRNFRLDISFLSEGKYILSLALFQKNVYGTIKLVDFVNKAGMINKLSTMQEPIIWRKRTWGNAKLPDLSSLD